MKLIHTENNRPWLKAAISDSEAATYTDNYYIKFVVLGRLTVGDHPESATPTLLVSAKFS